MRIYITGPSWSGKSTLARELWLRFDTPVIHLDNMLWKEDLVENEDYWKLQLQAVAGKNWIIEGSSVSILKLMRDRVDIIIILNYQPMGNMIRILGRFLKGLWWEKQIGFDSRKSHRFPLELLFKTTTWQRRQLRRIRANIIECSFWDKVIEIHSIENALGRVIATIGGVMK